MGSDGKSDGAVKTILIGVVLALAVGGSAPWWWTMVFPPNPPKSTITDDPPKETHAGLGACSSGGTASGAFHDVAAANGSWDWNCDGQLERQYTACENLTRAQCDPNSNAAHGPAGFCSELRAPGGCQPKVASCGQSGYIYPCFYNAADGRCHAGGYETATVMGCR